MRQGFGSIRPGMSRTHVRLSVGMALQRQPGAVSVSVIRYEFENRRLTMLVRVDEGSVGPHLLFGGLVVGDLTHRKRGCLSVRSGALTFHPI